MASLGDFGPHFNKSVPHILEKIFCSLDYYSFMSCRKVCRTWDKLLTSGSYKTYVRSKKMLQDKIKGEENLYKSSSDGNVEDVKYLLSIGVDPNCQEYYSSGQVRSPLHMAAMNGYHLIVKILLDSGAEHNKENCRCRRGSLLSVGIRSGHENVVKLLLDAGVDPNVRCWVGKTPLDNALSSVKSARFSRKIIQLLIDRGAIPTKHQRKIISNIFRNFP